jgi:hypothetical protein
MEELYSLIIKNGGYEYMQKRAQTSQSWDIFFDCVQQNMQEYGIKFEEALWNGMWSISIHWFIDDIRMNHTMEKNTILRAHLMQKHDISIKYDLKIHNQITQFLYHPRGNILVNLEACDIILGVWGDAVRIMNMWIQGERAPVGLRVNCCVTKISLVGPEITRKIIKIVNEYKETLDRVIYEKLVDIVTHDINP